MLRLRTLGGLAIERLDGPSPSAGAASARRRLALLAVLATTRDRGMRRDKLLTLFWPESNDERGRHALAQALFTLKRDLEHDELVIGREEPRLNPDVITSDVGELETALANRDCERAVQLYAGPFLDGFFLSGSPEFEQWVDGERARLARDVENAFELLANQASARGDHGSAIMWLERLAAMNPRRTRVVIALMNELAASGDRAAALRYANMYHTLIRDDLEVEPNPAVTALAERLKREPVLQAITPPMATPLQRDVVRDAPPTPRPAFDASFTERYAIDREIGRGATATVYLARDLRHDRLVALKVLRPELAATVVVERFRQEIAVSANMQHPHILPIYEAGACDGTLFFAMPYVAGESLRQRMDRQHVLDVGQALRFARDVADALAYAHRSGIVHRDIKPENILITSEHAVVADFGLARALGVQSTTQRPTLPGTVVGTPIYLSPEVAGGFHDADARSDQFSLACVVYEMLVGEIPSIPADVRDSRIPPRVRAVLQRALAVNPSQRFPDVAAFGRALSPALTTRSVRFGRGTAIAAGTAFVVIASLVAWIATRGRSPVLAERAWILPADVVNRTQDSVFNHALDEPLATGLQQSSYVNVFPRVLVQQALARMGKASSTTSLSDSLARDLAQREGVRAVVTTVITRVDSSYTLTLRLTDPASGAAIAAVSGIAKGRAGMVGVLDDLVRQLRRRIGESASMLAKHDRPLARVTTGSLEALRKYSACSRAWTWGSHAEAIELCEQAVTLDPDFAAAHALLGAAYYWNNNRPVGDAHFDRALAHLDRLTDRERFTVQANAESWRGNRERSIQIRRALIEQYPDDRFAWAGIGYDFMRLNRPREAIDAYQHQLAIDSSDANNYVNMAVAYKELGTYDDAVRAYEHAFSRAPNLLTSENLNHEYGMALILGGHVDRARAAYETMLQGDADQQARGHRSIALLEMLDGRYGVAISELRRATAITQATRQPTSEVRNRLFLAAAEREKGWLDSARMELRAARRIFYQSYLEPAFLLTLGRQLVEDGQILAAREVLDTLSRRSRPTSRDDRISRWQLAGELALASHRADSALHLFQLAYATDSNALVAAAVARGLAAAGDLKGAAQRWRALAAAPRLWLGWEGELYGLHARLEEAGIDERLRDTAAARAAYSGIVAQWRDGDSDLVSLREAKGRLRAGTRITNHR